MNVLALQCKRAARGCLNATRQLRAHLLGPSDFQEFESRIHPGTWAHHDAVLGEALGAFNNVEMLEAPGKYAESADAAVHLGWRLANEAREAFRGKFAGKTGLRFLTHVPPVELSPGGFSLFRNMAKALDYLGVPSRFLGWNESTDSVLNEFQPNVLISSDSPMFLERIDWDAVARYRRKRPLHVGLTAALESEGNPPLGPRLDWAEKNGIDFFYRFDCEEFNEKACASFIDAGYLVLSVEFGANPLLHYPVPGFRRDLPYIFLASSNPDKQERYCAWLDKVFHRYPGFIDGPGWPKITYNLAERARHGLFEWDRYLYARAKVGINLHIPFSIEHASQLNERTYILAACGIPQLVDNAKLLGERFPKEALFIASTPAEFAGMFRQILENPAEAERRALLAMQTVFEKHTVFHRMEKFIMALEKISESEENK